MYFMSYSTKARVSIFFIQRKLLPYDYISLKLVELLVEFLRRSRTEDCAVDACWCFS